MAQIEARTMVPIPIILSILIPFRKFPIPKKIQISSMEDSRIDSEFGTPPLPGALLNVCKG